MLKRLVALSLPIAVSGLRFRIQQDPESTVESTEVQPTSEEASAADVPSQEPTGEQASE